MFKKILFSTIASVSILTSASAAELGAFMMKLQGGYAMGDSSFKVSNTTTTLGTVKNNNLNGMQGIIGFGYVASEDILTDITVSFDQNKTKNDLTNVGITQVENKNLASLLNAYYNFNIGNNFSPYIMAGAGAGFSKAKITLPTDGMVIDGNTVITSADTLSYKNTTYFAYQGGFGMSFNMMKSIALDLGYRIGNTTLGKVTAVNQTNVTTTLSSKSQLKQSVLLGINIFI